MLIKAWQSYIIPQGAWKNNKYISQIYFQRENTCVIIVFGHKFNYFLKLS